MQKNEKEEKQKEDIRTGNISLILDSYDDLFSDFDPRQYSERALSDDFLMEVKRAARDKELELELILSVPGSKRNTADESKIKKRIKSHFKKHHIEKEKEIKKMKNKGIMWIVIGSILLITTAILETYTRNLVLNFILVITTPAGWFSFWEGLGKIFIYSKEKEPDSLFYKKMSTSKISFRSY